MLARASLIVAFEVRGCITACCMAGETVCGTALAGPDEEVCNLCPVLCVFGLRDHATRLAGGNLFEFFDGYTERFGDLLEPWVAVVELREGLNHADDQFFVHVGFPLKIGL
jgi:hypothetical protein